MENQIGSEYNNPNTFFDITFDELTNKLEKLRLDTIQANDPEVKAFAENKYMEYRVKYFNLLNQDLQLQKLYEEVDENV